MNPKTKKSLVKATGIVFNCLIIGALAFFSALVGTSLADSSPAIKSASYTGLITAAVRMLLYLARSRKLPVT